MDPKDDSTKPVIVYPSIWVYAVIGSDEEVLRAGILAIVKNRQHTLQFSHRSNTSKYCSFHLETPVQNETERNALYKELKAIPTVKMVL